MRSLRYFSLLSACCAVSFAQPAVDVGSGSPTGDIQQQFIGAWERNGFNLLVALPPVGNVAPFGPNGLIQQFHSIGNSATLLALIKPDMDSNSDDVVQVLAPMYAYYTTVGQTTAGYPTADTQNCPNMAALSDTCQWQPFSNHTTLFAYAQPLPGGAQNISVNGSFYTTWLALGGIDTLEAATSAQTSVTSVFGTAATAQTFYQGAVYDITSGRLSGQFLSVIEPIYDVYIQNSAAAGPLGLPITGVLAASNGMREQEFEGGAIEYDPTTGIAVLRPPVASVAMQPIGSVHMNAGDTLALHVTVYAVDGSVLTDRTVSWSTTNGLVAQIQASGLTATVKAVGAGVATITAISEGKTSLPLNISVTAPCCQIGEGSPTAALQQAFQAAVTRNMLSVQIPAAAAVSRAGNGYMQQLLSTGSTPVPYLVAVPDGSASGYVVAGALLTQYLALGGPTGSLGYPLSDATAGGRQTFQQGTLAGNPVQLVTGAILAEWATLGYETGIAGSPTGAATSFLTFRATSGTMQAFQNALILSSSSGQTFFVSGLILAKYTSNGGPSGALGAPTDNQFAINGTQHQDFEGGYLDYAPGDSAATLVASARQPLVTATPSSVLSGGTVHLTIGGFNNGATVRVSQTGQADFLVTVSSGSYVWDAYVPPSSPSGVIAIVATDASGAGSAKASYAIRNAATAPLTISAAGGDQQTGAPGAQLGQPLVVVVKDQFGNPAPGQTVSFTASPGAQILPASSATDANGHASALLRLPMAGGVTLVTAQAGHQPVTFSELSAAFSLTNFPALTQAVSGTLGNGTDTIQQKGALLTAVASIVSYRQARGEFPQPNGLAGPLTLNQFLKSFCQLDSSGNQICDGFVSIGQSSEQTLNLWRVGAFVGGGVTVSVESPDLNSVRDLVASGSPVLLALSLANLGSHFVTATGINSDGSLAIVDPNPAFARTNLNDYLNGFTGASGSIQGTLTGAVRLLAAAPSSPGFLAVSNVPVVFSSVAGACGQTLPFAGIAAVAGVTPASAPGTLYFRPCNGSGSVYEMDIQMDIQQANQGSFAGTFTDLGPVVAQSVLAGNGATSFEAVRNNAQWTLSPLQLSFTSASVVNAASFTTEIAPGGLISIYGFGFSSSVTAQVNGQPATVLAAFPFQVNAQIPPGIPAGAATISITSGNGTAEQPVAILSVAPAIFSIGSGQAAITNQDNSLNTPSNPAARGGAIIIYATGLGAVASSGGLSPAQTPVTVAVGGVEIPALFAGLTPGYTGLYQANVVLPPALAPGLYLPLYLKQGGTASNTVLVSVQ